MLSASEDADGEEERGGFGVDGCGDGESGGGVIAAGLDLANLDSFLPVSGELGISAMLCVLRREGGGEKEREQRSVIYDKEFRAKLLL